MGSCLSAPRARHDDGGAQATAGLNGALQTEGRPPRDERFDQCEASGGDTAAGCPDLLSNATCTGEAPVLDRAALEATDSSQLQRPYLVLSAGERSVILSCMLANDAAARTLGLRGQPMQEFLRFLAAAAQRDQDLCSLLMDLALRLLSGHLTGAAAAASAASHLVPGNFGPGAHFLSLRLSPVSYRVVLWPAAGSGYDGAGEVLQPALAVGMELMRTSVDLAARVQRDALFLSSIPAVVTMFDLHGCVLHQNRASAALFGQLEARGEDAAAEVAAEWDWEGDAAVGGRRRPLDLLSSCASRIGTTGSNVHSGSNAAAAGPSAQGEAAAGGEEAASTMLAAIPAGQPLRRLFAADKERLLEALRAVPSGVPSGFQIPPHLPRGGRGPHSRLSSARLTPPLARLLSAGAFKGSGGGPRLGTAAVATAPSCGSTAASAAGSVAEILSQQFRSLSVEDMSGSAGGSRVLGADEAVEAGAPLEEMRAQAGEGEGVPALPAPAAEAAAAALPGNAAATAEAETAAAAPAGPAGAAAAGAAPAAAAKSPLLGSAIGWAAALRREAVRSTEPPRYADSAPLSGFPVPSAMGGSRFGGAAQQPAAVAAAAEDGGGEALHGVLGALKEKGPAAGGGGEEREGELGVGPPFAPCTFAPCTPRDEHSAGGGGGGDGGDGDACADRGGGPHPSRDMAASGASDGRDSSGGAGDGGGGAGGGDASCAAFGGSGGVPGVAGGDGRRVLAASVHSAPLATLRLRMRGRGRGGEREEALALCRRLRRSSRSSGRLSRLRAAAAAAAATGVQRESADDAATTCLPGARGSAAPLPSLSGLGALGVFGGFGDLGGVQESGASAVFAAFGTDAIRKLATQQHQNTQQQQHHHHHHKQGGPSQQLPRARNSSVRLDLDTWPTAAVAAALQGGGDHAEGGESDDGGGAECRWHEVAVRPCTDPLSGQRVLLVVQQDVTCRVRAESALVEVLEAKRRLLADILPRHVVRHMTQSRREEAARERSAGHLPGGPGTSLVVPPHVKNPSLLATQHESLTILFADIKEFTEMSKSVAPETVLTFLNDLYTRFDGLVDLFGVYKVETIGDCYMAVGGLVARDEDGYGRAVRGSGNADPLHAMRVVAFARALLEEASRMVMPHTGKPVQVRVGVHSGPAISGVVGLKMPRFCLFGDTVNTASRMETTGKPGAIHASAAARLMLPPDEDHEGWQATGGVEVKGKGKLDTFLWRPWVAAPAGGGHTARGLSVRHQPSSLAA
ncbi:Guanylate cyclase soluble subunit beta-2 [Tetrabaena socialis]|uniref:Guanylate cyclase soluble subunit beta-2 n=1 Tax=Tetrabaena socialis TaxID=47790 RepID=A0A2J8A3K5_9CHLO|nr:Guanylate cyclase soluble subunit beta-2 [Tetrabaena socialis]|eukprot:PNH07109.1 Guanylate cyclase soluble subunit beta-2 [Tetrabaena socialis]